MELSVIVPVYNVEKYLSRCLNSLLRQGMETGEWEVICVNDGSHDNSAAILAEYEQKYPDVFKVVTQENKGAGEARNVGTAMARGEFVTYLDSDDYLVDGAYRYLLDHFCDDGERDGGKVKLDVLHYNYRYVYTDGKTLYDPDAKPDGKISIEGDGVDVHNQYKLSYVWSKFYRRAFLEEHHIQSGITICHDQMFNFNVFRQHPYTRVVTSSVVRYENSNGTSIQKTTDREVVFVQLKDLYNNMENIRRYVDDNAQLAPAAHRILAQFTEIYYNKMIRTNLRYADWEKYTKVLDVQEMGESFIVLKNGWVARALGVLKEMAFHSYIEYLFVRFIYREIFVRFFFEKIYNKR